MRNALKRIAILGLVFGGMLLYTGDWRVSFFAWITPVLAIYVVRRNRLHAGLLPVFLLAVATAMLSRRGMSPLADVISMLIQSVIFALTFCVPLLVDRLLHKRMPGLLSTLLYPATLVALEFMNARGAWGSWGMLAHTQFAFPALMQTASLFGTFAVSFMVAWSAPIVNYAIELEINPRNLMKSAGVYGFILSVLLAYGSIRLELFSSTEETVRVAAITNETDLFALITNPEQAEDYLSPRNLVAEQVRRTEEAAMTGAKIIAWHEGSLVVDARTLDEIISEVGGVASQYGVYVLVSYFEIIESASGKPFRNRNAMIAPDGEVMWMYDKSRPVPMVELPVVVQGNGEIPYLDTEYGRIGAVICFDMDFYTLLKQASAKNIDILLVPAADWEGITPIHTYMASTEAVQNGFSMVRICGHGFTGAFNWNGTLIAGMNNYESESHMLLADVPTKARRTLYGVIGQVFALACVGFLLAAIAAVTFGSIRRKILRGKAVQSR